jgi:hypothetical protein
MLEAEQVARAYARWIAEGEREFQAMMTPDLHDHVSGGTGPADLGHSIPRYSASSRHQHRRSRSTERLLAWC